MKVDDLWLRCCQRLEKADFWLGINYCWVLLFFLTISYLFWGQLACRLCIDHCSSASERQTDSYPPLNPRPTMSARWFSPRVKLCFPAEASWLCLSNNSRFFSHTVLLKFSSVWNGDIVHVCTFVQEMYWILTFFCLSNSYLIVISFAILSSPVVPQSVCGRWRAAEGHSCQEQNCTQPDMHPRRNKQTNI